MNTQSIINEFKTYRKDNASVIQMLIKSDNVAKQYYDGIAEATENFTDYDPEILEATDFIEVMNRFNLKMKPFLSRSKGEPPTVGVYTVPKATPKPKQKSFDVGGYVTINDMEGADAMVFRIKSKKMREGGYWYMLTSDDGIDMSGLTPERALSPSTKEAYDNQNNPNYQTKPTAAKYKKGERVMDIATGKLGTVFDSNNKEYKNDTRYYYMVNWDGDMIGQAGVLESSLIRPDYANPPKPKRLFNKQDRVKNVKDGKVGTVYEYDERSGAYYYRINWDNSRIAQAGVPENLLEKYSKPKSTAKAKAAAKASATIKNSKASRKSKAKAKVKPLTVGMYVRRDNGGESIYGKITQLEKRRATVVFDGGIQSLLAFDEFVPVSSAEYNSVTKREIEQSPAKSTAKAKALAKASTAVKKAKASRKASSKPRVKKETSATNAEKASPSAKSQATPKAKAKPKAAAKPKATKPKATKPVEPEKSITRTQVETPEHKQIKRFLAIRKNETVQLAMTAYKSLQKDIAERKIRAVSPQAGVIKAVQLAYYKYITGQTNSLSVSEAILKEANEFVGSQKPYETVALVKRFIGWTGQGKTEKQISDYVKEAEKVIGAARENDPYYDELKAITKALKSTKAGDVVVADNVGLSGLRANTIKVRK